MSLNQIRIMRAKSTLTLTLVSGTMSFLKPAIHTRKVVCEARAVHNGKTISVYEVKLLDDKGELLETGTFTFYHMNREVLPETEA